MTKAVIATNKELGLDISYQTAKGWKRDKAARWAIFDERAKLRISTKFRPGWEAIQAKAQELALDILLNGEDGAYDKTVGKYMKKMPSLQAVGVIAGIASTKLGEMNSPNHEKAAKEPSRKSKKDLEFELTSLGRETAQEDEKVH